MYPSARMAASLNEVNTRTLSMARFAALPGHTVSGLCDAATAKRRFRGKNRAEDCPHHRSFFRLTPDLGRSWAQQRGSVSRAGCYPERHTAGRRTASLPTGDPELIDCGSDGGSSLLPGDLLDLDHRQSSGRRKVSNETELSYRHRERARLRLKPF
jgi:hypothetical protein